MCTTQECAFGGGIPTAGDDQNHPKTWCDGGTHDGEPIDLLNKIPIGNLAATHQQIIKELAGAVHEHAQNKKVA